MLEEKIKNIIIKFINLLRIVIYIKTFVVAILTKIKLNYI